MNNPRLIIGYSILFGIASAVTYICMRPLVALPVADLWFDAVVSGLLLATTSILLRFAVKYINYDSLPPVQRIINYGALGVLFVFVWQGGEFLILYIWSAEKYRLFMVTVPVRILVAALVYLVNILTYGYFKSVDKEDGYDPVRKEEAEEPEETLPEIKYLERVAVKNGQKIDMINVPEIVCIQAEGDYVMIYTAKGKYLKEETMKFFENNLPRNKFVRVHRSNIVNVDFIVRVERYEKQTQLLKMQNGLQVKMSVGGYKLLKEVLSL